LSTLTNGRRAARRIAAATAAAWLLAGTPAAHALEPVYENWRGLAIAGYDPVAYFAEGKPVAGSSDFTTEWKGATWRFASAAHRDQFAADPVKYAPQYGGYCAWAVSQGYTASSDPDAWRIVEGKLYLNYDKDIQKKWEIDIPGNIAKANESWPKLLGGR
jgi:hypothetical protein